MIMSRLGSEKRIRNAKWCIGIFLAVGLALAGMISTLAVKSAYAASTQQVTFTMEQVIANNSLSMPLSTTFTYRLLPKTTDAPMPYGGDSQGHTFTITGTQEAHIGPINFNTPGIFIYELSCLTDIRSGFSIDRRIYTIEVCVTSDLQVVMTVYTHDNIKVPSIHFEHVHWMSAGVTGGLDGFGTPGIPGGLQGRPETVEESGAGVFIRPIEPGLPQDGKVPSEPIAPEEPDAADTPLRPIEPSKSDSPLTGDFSNPWLWITLIASAGALLAFIVFIDCKSRRGRSS